ncbi:MAG: hypothetical protein CMO80_04075 [Verrucomicrobiales bacterium]|nr:hypothetical protein [Verrucomicrobiales bacterium]
MAKRLGEGAVREDEVQPTKHENDQLGRGQPGDRRGIRRWEISNDRTGAQYPQHLGGGVGLVQLLLGQ